MTLFVRPVDACLAHSKSKGQQERVALLIIYNSSFNKYLAFKMMSKQIVTLILCNLALASSQPRGATRYGSAIRGRRRVQEEMGGAGGKDALVGGMDEAGAMDEPGAMQIGADGCKFTNYTE